MFERTTRYLGGKQEFDVLSEGLRRKLVLPEAILVILMDLSPFRQNFEKNRNRQKYQHSLKEHPKFTKIAKFGCEMS